jgi:hypothetical protein
MTNVFEGITAVSTAIIMLTLVVLIVLLIVAAVRTRAAGRKFELALQRIYEDLQPVIARSKTITDDVSAVTRSIRQDVADVSETVTSANDKVRAALAATEARLAEFNALLNVVQDEAEDLFVSTASAVRGVGRGAASFRRRGGTELASHEERDGADGTDADRDEEEDADDSRADRGSDEAPAPRVRSRARRPHAS